MYNFLMAFVLCGIAYVIGEAVSTATKAWIPSVFVTAAIVLIGYWTVIPKTLVTDAGLFSFSSTVGYYLILVHMGTVISLKQMKAQWKTIIVCLIGLLGMCTACALICIPLIGKDYVVAGLPPLTGGLVAAITMQNAAAEKGLEMAALFAIAMYCVQGFAGYPLTSVCLQFEGKKLLKKYRSGEASVDTSASTAAVNAANQLETGTASQTEKKKLLHISEKWNTPAMILLKLGIVGWMASMMGTIQFPVIGKISGAVWSLVLGIFFTSIGFLDTNALNKANASGFIMFAVMMYVFDGLKTATPEMFAEVLVPMILLIVVGVAGMALAELVASRLLKIDYCLALANGLTALYGFPPNAVITENTCKALSKDTDEFNYLMGEMYPSMIVGGFVTVTITSVILAGLFTNLL